MRRKKLENYIIDMHDLLGAGSFGQVYKGYNELTDQTIAAKVLAKKQVEADDNIKQALFLEIKIMQKLKSKNIVRILDVLQTNHNYYLIEEYCNGKNLKIELREKKRFSQQLAIGYLKDICNGFIELISHGVIHRDVKPQNILIHDGILKIADFGFAKSVISNAQLNATMVGTPLYMSPQQLKCQKYSSKCDIWAIGLIFYEMVCGKLPWTGRSEYELLKNELNFPLFFPKEVPWKDNVKSFITGCLKIEEKDRFSWRDLYNHPIFEGMFEAYAEKIEEFNHRAKYALTKLRLQIHSSNIDIEKTAKKLQIQRVSRLDFQQFYEFLRGLQHNIDMDEAKFIFDKVDKSKSGKVLFDNIANMLKDSDINLTQTNSNLPRKVQTFFLGGDKSHTNVQLRAKELLHKLRKRLEAKNYDLKEVFKVYDRNKDQVLSFEEFGKLIVKIDSNVTMDQIGACFDQFDKNKDGMITFEEFQTTIFNGQRCKSQPSSPLHKISAHLPDRPPSARRDSN